jgi:hypothetical protein
MQILECLGSLDDYKKIFGNCTDTELAYYQTFLIMTDYVAAKIAEAVYLGKTLDEDYSETLTDRQYCRDRINELKALLP